MKAKNLKRREFPEPVLVPASFSQIEYAHSLLETSLFDDATKNKHANSLEEISEGQCEELITMLLENQRNNILGGFNYQQGDIQKMLKQLKRE